MSINSAEFREFFIRPPLQTLGCWSPSLENLLLGTAAQASDMGNQLGVEKGLGIYHIKQDVHIQVWDKFFAFDADLASAVRGLASQREFIKQPHRELITNFCYATAIAWGVYAYKGATIPQDADDIEALALCWHLHFNDDPNSGTQHFSRSFKKVCHRKNKMAAA